MRKKFSIPDFQTKLPFGSAIRGRRIGFVLERRGLTLVLLAMGAVTIIYVYGIVASVAHTVAREELARDNRERGALVSTLEREYLEKGGLITEAYARSIGFVTPSSQVFLEVAGRLSLRDAR